MKRTTKILTVAVAALLSVSALHVLAEEGKFFRPKGERPMFFEKSKDENFKKENFGKKFNPEDIKTDLEEKLNKGEITEEEYNKIIGEIESGEFRPGFKPEFENNDEFKKPREEKKELTEEQKAQMLEKKKEFLEKIFQEGKITEEEYNKQIENIENGNFEMRMGPPRGRGMHWGKGRGHRIHKKHFEEE